MAQLMDQVTNNCDWTIHQDLSAMPRSAYLSWYWQIKFIAAKNVAHVCDKMLHACGGSGFKKDMEIERYLRDGKAGWVMGPPTKCYGSLWASWRSWALMLWTTGTSG